jgi:hypothetical protein
MEENGKKKSNRTVLIIVLCIVGLLTICCVVTVISGIFSNKMDQFMKKEVKKEGEITKEEEKKEKKNDFEMLENFGNDDWAFMVGACEWSKYVGDGYFGSRANANYMKIYFCIVNISKEPHYLMADFSLVDNEGNKYDRSDDEFYLGDKAFFLDKLNPGVSKGGILLFDVPKKEGYKLKVQTDFFSEPVYVNLKNMSVSEAQKLWDKKKKDEK